MIHVTFCAYDKPDSVGGPLTWLRRLLPALRGYGIEARCLFLTHWGGTGPYLEALRADGFVCHQAACHDHTHDRIKWILSHVRDDPPDVFVPNLVVAGYFAGRWIRGAGIPTVGVIHSDDAFSRGLRDEFFLGEPRYRVSGLVCVSEELEKQVFRNMPPTAFVNRIPCGVPVPERVAKRIPLQLRLVYVGRLTEEAKRISEMTRSLCIAARKVPGTSAVICGDGPDRGNVERILATEGVGLEVHLIGSVPNDEIQSRLLELDVFVLLSDNEGLPIALMEAMACGVVPVCLRTRSGIPELVQDGVTGLIVDNREESFVNAIERLQNEPGLWERLSSAARHKVETEYSEKACVERWAGLFHKLHKENVGRKRAIRIPGRLRLPPINPSLASADPRPSGPSLPERLYRRGRMSAGKIKRRLLGQPTASRPIGTIMTTCIIQGADNPTTSSFIRAHIEYLAGEKVVLTNYYPQLAYKGREIRYFYSQRPLLKKLAKLMPHWFYHRFVTLWEETYAGRHDAIAAFMQQHKVDVILAEFGIHGSTICPHARDLGIPLIVHFHGHDAHRDPLLANFTDRYKVMFDYAFKLISVSHFMTDKLIRMGADPAKIVYNPYGPRESFFANQPDYRKTFLAVGRFTDIKAPYLTLMAFRQVLEAHTDAKLVMAGDGELLEACKTLVKTWGIEAQVAFPGALRHEEVIPLFAGACCFVQHSVMPTYGDAEGTPVAILEAGAAALPVVSTKHAGIPDAVVHGKTGFLVDEHDVDGMARYMCELLDDRDLCRSMGLAAREHIRDNYNINRHIACIDNLVDEARRAGQTLSSRGGN